jgi:hypothetical protein
MVAASQLRDAYCAMVASRGVPLIPGTRDPRQCGSHWFAWCVPYVQVLKPETDASAWIAKGVRRTPSTSFVFRPSHQNELASLAPRKPQAPPPHPKHTIVTHLGRPGESQLRLYSPRAGTKHAREYAGSELGGPCTHMPWTAREPRCRSAPSTQYTAEAHGPTSSDSCARARASRPTTVRGRRRHRRAGASGGGGERVSERRKLRAKRGDGVVRGRGLGALDDIALALHGVELHEVAQRLPVLLLVVAHVDKDVVQRLELRALA